MTKKPTKTEILARVDVFKMTTQAQASVLSTEIDDLFKRAKACTSKEEVLAITRLIKQKSEESKKLSARLSDFENEITTLILSGEWED